MDGDVIVIYHAKCPDGLTAAWCLKKLGYHCIFHPTNERELKNDAQMPPLNKKNIYILDFSYSRDDLAYLAKVANSVVVLDHHSTAAEALKEKIHGVECVFDMNRCGAEITWDYFMPTVARPWWFKHIRDRDLWEWKHPHSKSFGALVFERGLTFETLDFVDSLDPQGQQDFINRGTELLRFQENEVQRLVQHAQLVKFQGHRVYCLESLNYRSECGNVLASRSDCEFALLYSFDVHKKEWLISLRGVAEKEIDLSKIAESLGGGGHRLACGFKYKGSLSDLIE
jgi:oligoribonuclease NrnB/cAMP/cGMP phosphodiesterase (DHH superfamily)